MLYLPTLYTFFEAALTGNSASLFPFSDSEEPHHFVALDYKWLVRKVRLRATGPVRFSRAKDERNGVACCSLPGQVWIVAGLAIVLHRLIAYQDYERENHKILKRLEQKIKVVSLCLVT
jgi:hypothetical protein